AGSSLDSTHRGASAAIATSRHAPGRTGRFRTMSYANSASSELPAEEKAKRSGSFGAVAAEYERYRPGPSLTAVEWMLPDGVDGVIDLGAGTGALTRLLVGRVQHVIAVEPDGRMRAVLIEQVPDARAIEGRGDSMPLPDNCADAVLASSSWH